MKMYKAAIFDVDGTLLDTTEGVLASVKYAIQAHGLKELSREQLKNFIGPPIQDSFKYFYNTNEEMTQKLAETFRNQYKTFDLFKAKPYEGIFDVFHKLNEEGISLAVATYKRQDYATKILEHFGFDKYTKILYGADQYNKLRKKDIIKKCMVDLKIEDYSSAVMIGDSDNDAVGARDIGMAFLGVSYGFGFKNEKEVLSYNAIGCAKRPIDIISYFI